MACPTAIPGEPEMEVNHHPTLCVPPLPAGQPSRRYADTGRERAGVRINYNKENHD